MIRPEAMYLDPRTEDARHLSGRLVDRVFLGAFIKLQLRLADGSEIAVHLPGAGASPLPAMGEEVTIGWRADDVRYLDHA